MNQKLSDILVPANSGCWIDGGHQSGDYLSYRIIRFAHELGYDVDMKQVESDMADFDNVTYEIQADISEGLWEESALAIDWLNDATMKIDGKYYWFIDDNSLYLEYDSMEGAEYNTSENYYGELI